MSLYQPECLWNVGAELGEGALWHAASKQVYFVDIKGGKIHRCAPDGTQRRSWDTPETPGFVLPVAGGGFICGMRDGIYRFDEHSGAFSRLQDVERDLASNRLNDGYVAADGALWFGSMDDEEYRTSGVLYRLDASGQSATLTPVERDYIITNGPAMSPDGRTLYHNDTMNHLVYAFDVLPGGRLDNKRVFHTFADTEYSDGMAVDSRGDVWVALFCGGRIDRFTSTGEFVQSV